MSNISLTRRALLAGGSLALAGVGTGASALAQQAAGKTIQFILPVAVASGVDTITRSAQNELSKALGATVVVNNQPGAGGLIGTQQLVEVGAGRPDPVDRLEQPRDLSDGVEVHAVRSDRRHHADRDPRIDPRWSSS